MTAPPTGAQIKGIGPAIGRTIHYPFSVPKQMNDSALVVNQAAHTLVGGMNSLFAQTLTILKPRPFLVKAIAPLVQRIDQAVPASAAKGQRASDVFWGPAGNAIDGVGDALTGWMTIGALKKAGYPDPTFPEATRAVLHKTDLPAPRANMAAASGGGEPQAAPVAAEPEPSPTPQPPAPEG